MILLVDNYDSFTYNLVQAIEVAGRSVRVLRNDELDVEEELARKPERIVISPGPGRPELAGRSIEVIRAAERERIPLLGVCLGHQAIAAAHGAVVSRALVLMHGKTSKVTHSGRDIFRDLPNPFDATRYHSLAVEEGSLPPEILVTARAEEGTVMGLRLGELPVFGVQFHPESILTPEGPRLIANFLSDELR